LDRLASCALPVLLDYNASATSIASVWADVEAVTRVARLVGVEQPFAAGNVIDHVKLARRLEVPVGLDEGMRGLADLDAAVVAGAAKLICVKPARVGGLVAARAVMARAIDHGVAAYVGGFFESAFARSVHRVLADSLASAPSDVGLVARQDFHEPEAVEVPSGLGSAPSEALLAHARALVDLG
jgi:O-succinylbenzoate synthase